MIVVSNTSPITSLAAIGQLDLLRQLYGKIIIPEAVYRELTEVNYPVPGTIEVQTCDWIEIKSLGDRNQLLGLFSQPLDEGESWAIVLTLELSADLLLIDERRGRSEANRLGLRITGLLGVLVEAKQKKLISALKPLLDSLKETAQFRVTEQLYIKILQMVGEG
ncbi:DUF3368 domain-containing protein [Crocosphaera sp.]|uniref:DUF3368 domain-containing protein n=1 Tax=Crocosphaera sp. TaxID=2729996 RepID=UPI00262D6A18|nr:DUF3368 domain-containing protein [Crocosphaera sp.]MDJ0582394.1 DUF3368 domain-containing protein [Crocosphaera sp.]